MGKFFLILLSCLFFCFSYASGFSFPGTPTDSIDSLSDRQLLFAVDYLSNKTYLGRQNTVLEKYVAPSLSYQATSGFFSSIVIDKIVSPENRFDAAAITAGWKFNVSKTVETSLRYSHFIFSKKTIQIISALRNNIEASFIKEFKWVSPQLYLDLNFGQGSPDYSIRFEIYHDFEIDNVLTKNNDALIISPTVSISAATLNFYSVYLRDSSLSRIIRNAAVNVNSKFQLASVDLALPVEYDIGNFLIRPEIRQTIPLYQMNNSDNKAVTYFIFTLGYFFMGSNF
ncbi:MAG: hypothetical protein JJE25_04185 [Bacteroidia bacterium]|nr:hypothetical protein [Bacteroidia bacterium]